MTQDARAFNWDSIPSKNVATTNPAANTTISYTVPAGKRWLVLGAMAVFTTDGTAANRFPYIQFKPDGTNATARYMTTTAHTASIALTYSFASGANAAVAMATGLAATVPMGDNIDLPAGAVIEIFHVNGVAADDWGAAQIWYKEAPA